MIDSQEDIGGWPTLQDTGKLTDSDNDGIPDEWEKAHGLTVGQNNSKTFNLDTRGYYTDLEVYANYLVQAITQYERTDATATFEEYYPLGVITLDPEADFPTSPDFKEPNEQTNGISNMTTSAKHTNGTYYNLLGQCVTPTSKGILIHNGIKIVNKP